MPITYQCPQCLNRVLVPNNAAKIIGESEQLGCGNYEEHASGEAIVMQPEGTF